MREEMSKEEYAQICTRQRERVNGRVRVSANCATDGGKGKEAREVCERVYVYLCVCVFASVQRLAQMRSVCLFGARAHTHTHTHR